MWPMTILPAAARSRSRAFWAKSSIHSAPTAVRSKSNLRSCGGGHTPFAVTSQKGPGSTVPTSCSHAHTSSCSPRASTARTVGLCASTIEPPFSTDSEVAMPLPIGLGPARGRGDGNPCWTRCACTCWTASSRPANSGRCTLTTTWRPSVSSTPCTLATPIRWNTTDFIRDPTLRRQYSSRRRLTLAGSLVPKSANSRSFDSGVEILQYRGKCLEGRFRHGLDDELNMPDPFARIGTQLIGNDLRTSPKRCCHRRSLVHVLPTGPTRHLHKDGDRPLDFGGRAAGSDTGIVDGRT